ncbi:MAG: hypothetical protein M3Z09_06470 [Acidobacteriota bacterium]|nr:hypothetical protein [Acidobacteriota bacterium]
MKKFRREDDRHADLLMACSPGKLDAEKNIELTRHLESCPQCAQTLEAQRTVWKALDDWEAPGISAGFNRALYAKIEASGAAHRWYDRLAVSLKLMFAQPALALAFAGLLVAAGFILDHPGAAVSPVTAIHPSSLKVSAKEAEQVEKTLDDLEMLRQFDLNSDEKEAVSKSM